MVTAPIPQPLITLAQFLGTPETKPCREYWHQRIISKPMPQGQRSLLQGRLVGVINGAGLPNQVAYGLPELRCTFGGVSIVPDVAVFTWSRLPRDGQGRLANRFTTYPDWIIEILSPEQSSNQVLKKVLFAWSREPPWVG